jgi:outer membrane protein OmpA-like peptidoglycan-associated protein
MEKGDVKNAKKFLHKALSHDSSYYKANFGMGILYSDLVEDYDEALPYLKRAYRHRPKKDSIYDAVYALAKSYHHNGEFETAMLYYNRMDKWIDTDHEFDFQADVRKRKADCEYAIRHRNDPVPQNILVVNAGRTLNSDKPEYGAVLGPRHEIYFTSKRKDEKFEPLNFMDGKYFESIYVANITPYGFNDVRRYSLPAGLINTTFNPRHNAVVSLTQDASRLITFKKGAIYEVKIGGEREEPKRLLVAGHKKSFQNHAFITRDNNTLYFTSDIAGGYGGTDIYKSVRGSDGNWGEPQNLGNTINTQFDEDAPFLSPDGSMLYFSSMGHEGFGNHDIYKSRIENGTFGKPENMGAPYNSPSHDVFLVTDSTSENAYLSSGRNGGFGDMDIYKIIDLDKVNRECPVQPGSPLTLALVPGDTSAGINVTAELPSGYKVLEYGWNINGERVAGTATSAARVPASPGTYTVSTKMMIICDTCIAPMIVCADITTEITTKPEPEFPADTTSVTPAVTPLPTGTLSADQLFALGYDIAPLQFGFDRSGLDAGVREVLVNNAEVLKKNRDLTIELYGYTDARGKEHHNLILSKRRARVVSSFLLKNGVARSQITIVEGRGSADLLNDCGKGKKCAENAHRQNRRVLVVVKKNP